MPPLRRRASESRPRLYRARFDRLVQRALRHLPEHFAAQMENVAIIVEDAATPQQIADAGLRPGDDLYGLYQGIPRPQRAATYGMVLPDKITLFQRAIERDCRSEAEIVAQVRQTIIHELAHHFGIDDERLDELGVD